MEVAIYQRVKCVLEDKSISVNALSKQINVAQATLNPQLSGDRTLAANIVEKILEAFPDVSAEWLMRGVGAMYSNKDADDYSCMVAEILIEQNLRQKSIIRMILSGRRSMMSQRNAMTSYYPSWAVA